MLATPSGILCGAHPIRRNPRVADVESASMMIIGFPDGPPDDGRQLSYGTRTVRDLQLCEIR